MIAIKNIKKIVGKRIPNDWVVDEVYEEKGRYSFILDHLNNNGKIDYTTKISLNKLHGAELPDTTPLYQFQFEGKDIGYWGDVESLRSIDYVLNKLQNILNEKCGFVK